MRVPYGVINCAACLISFPKGSFETLLPKHGEISLAAVDLHILPVHDWHVGVGRGMDVRVGCVDTSVLGVEHESHLLYSKGDGCLVF